MKVTKRLLQRKGACSNQVAEFARLFPKGVEITQALCIEHAVVFDWNWAAENLLSAAAWDEYVRVRAPARVEYNRVTAPAQAEYNRIKAAAFGRLVDDVLPYERREI